MPRHLWLPWDKAKGNERHGALTCFSAPLLADLLLLTGLASSVFIVSELLKLCERYFSAARKRPKDTEDGSPRLGP